MLPALENLAPAADNLAPAAALLGSVIGAIGLWIGGYVALSLSLALCWILLVTFGRIYARKKSLTADSRTPGLGVSLPLGLRFWQQPDDAFGHEFRDTLGNELRDLGSSLLETEPGKEKEPASHPSP